MRKDPDGLALLQALFSDDEIKTGTWQDLLSNSNRMDAQTALVGRHDEAIRHTRIKKWEDQVQTIPGLSRWMRSKVDFIPRLPQGCNDRARRQQRFRSSGRMHGRKSRSKQKASEGGGHSLVEPIKELGEEKQN